MEEQQKKVINTLEEWQINKEEGKEDPNFPDMAKFSLKPYILKNDNQRFFFSEEAIEPIRRTIVDKLKNNPSEWVIRTLRHAHEFDNGDLLRTTKVFIEKRNHEVKARYDVDIFTEEEKQEITNISELEQLAAEETFVSDVICEKTAWQKFKHEIQNINWNSVLIASSFILLALILFTLLYNWIKSWFVA